MRSMTVVAVVLPCPTMVLHKEYLFCATLVDPQPQATRRIALFAKDFPPLLIPGSWDHTMPCTSTPFPTIWLKGRGLIRDGFAAMLKNRSDGESRLRPRALQTFLSRGTTTPDTENRGTGSQGTFQYSASGPVRRCYGPLIGSQSPEWRKSNSPLCRVKNY